MIKYAAYLPPKLLEPLDDLMDFHFLEPNTDAMYIDFYKRHSTKWKLLDNGLIEFGNAWNTPKLIEYAKQVGANEIIAPDRLGNWEHNYYNYKQLRREWSAGCGIVLAGPQWQAQCDVIIKLGLLVPLICLPYRLNRQPVETAKLHLLGFKLPEYYTPYRGTTQELSLDTVEPISAAYHKWSYAERGLASFPRPKEYDSLNPGLAIERYQIDLELVRSNIQWFKNYLNTRD